MYPKQNVFLRTKEAELQEEKSDRDRHQGTDNRPIFEEKNYWKEMNMN